MIKYSGGCFCGEVEYSVNLDELPRVFNCHCIDCRKKTGGSFESMIPKDNKYRTMEEYYYAVDKLHFRPKGVNLYVGNKDNILSPRINIYPEFNL